MSKKQIALRVLWTLIVILAIASVAVYLLLPTWKGFYLACCGGVIILNIVISIVLIHKQFK